MRKERVEGAIQKGVGALKQGVGRVTGNRRLQAEGLADTASGTAKQAYGKMKDAFLNGRR